MEVGARFEKKMSKYNFPLKRVVKKTGMVENGAFRLKL